MGFYEAVADSTEKTVKNIEPPSKRREIQAVEMQSPAAFKPKGFHEVEQIDIAEGWRQIVAGQWRGIGRLDVQEGQRHIWGKQIIIAEPAANRGKLQEHYPGVMIFTPAEFMDAVEHWPENEGVVLAKKFFNGIILGGVVSE